MIFENLFTPSLANLPVADKINGFYCNFTNLTRLLSVAGTIKGTVVDITESGDAVTDIENSRLADVPRDESISIACGGHKTVGLSPADHDQPEMTYIAVLGSSGSLELSLVGDSAAKFLCLKVGDQVKIAW